jgi:CubicO group peptidase (beta-lactamase class C family)
VTAPLAIGDFSGEVARGASCNCGSITLIPHCHGTHTECIGHLIAAPVHAWQVAPRTLQPALLLSVPLHTARACTETSRPRPQPEDLLVTRAALEHALRALPSTAQQLPTTAIVIRTLPNDRPHGGHFQYRSIITDVLAWVIESVGRGRFHELFAEDLWSRIGAEHDADVIVDSAGFALAEGGICATARDLLRFGLMVLDDGRVGDHQLVPASWFARLRRRDQDAIDAFSAYTDDPEMPDACYRDMWWVDDPAAGVFGASGINGQLLLIDRPTRTVVVKLSVWPDRWDQDAYTLTRAAMRALCAELGRS